MLPLEQPDRIQIAFDDHRLVANAGLLLPVTLAQRLGLSQLVDRHVDLGRAPGRANTGDKMMTLVASALAGGDCIDDADVLRAGGTAGAIGCVVKAPSTLGTFLRSFRWGHVRQLDRVSRELLALAWSAGAGPGDAPLTIDLDSTICETFGLAKEGARHHGYTGQRGYHPLLAIAAGTGDVLMCRLREGRANTVRGAAHFLRETVGRVRYAGASGQLTVRADSGFYAHALVAVCRNMDVRFSITIRQHQSLRNIIEAIPEEDWTAIPYWLDGAAAVAETSYTPFQSEPNAAPVRLIVRRVKPTPGSQLALFANYRYHGCITDRDGDTLDLEADHRRHAEIENAIRDLKYGVGLNHLPSGRFPANPEPAEGGLAGRTGHRPQPGSLDSAHRSGRATGDHQDPAATLLLPGRTAHPLSAPTHPAPATTLALGKPVQSCPGKIPRPPAPSLTAATSPPTRHPPHGTAPPTRTNPVREGHSLHTASRITPDMTTAGHQNRAGVATSRRPHPHLWNQTCPARLPLPIIPGFNPSDHRFGGFGLKGSYLMSTSDNAAQSTTEWIFVARSLARTANGQDQALRCMARAGMRAANADDWIVTAAAWEADFGDPAMARECLEKAELIAEETGEGWTDIAAAWAVMKNLRRVVEICREVHQPRPWPRIAEIQSQGPLPPGTMVLDWIEPGETRQASRLAVENADEAMENEDTVEAIRYLIDAESTADSTGDYVRIAERWRKWFPELDEFEEIMAQAGEAVDTPSDWVWIALKWKNDFQNYDNAVDSMWAATGGSVSDWEYVLRAWKDDFQDSVNFRRALNVAYGEVDSFDHMTSTILVDLDAYDLIEKTSLVDLGTLNEPTVSRVGTWDTGRLSERRPGSVAGHYRFNLSQAKSAHINLTSDVDNYLYLIQGEDPNGHAIAVDQGEGIEALSLITFNLDAGSYTIEVTTDQVQELGIFHLEIYLQDGSVV